MTIARLSAVLLNWKRPDNVARIVESLAGHPLIDDITVWNNNPASQLALPAEVRVISSPDLGLYTRFAAGCLARHQTLLIQDDDLLLPAETITALDEQAGREPAILHGIFGRGATSDGKYASRIDEGPAPIVLTRALVCPRSYCGRFFVHAPWFDEVQRDSEPYGNGEDIIFSFVAMKASGKLNQVSKLPVVELPAGESICGRSPSHKEHRTRILRACIRWLRG